MPRPSPRHDERRLAREQPDQEQEAANRLDDTCKPHQGESGEVGGWQLLTPLIMVGQNLLGHHAEVRAEHDLEVNVRAEREIEVILRHLEYQNMDLHFGLCCGGLSRLIQPASRWREVSPS